MTNRGSGVSTQRKEIDNYPNSKSGVLGSHNKHSNHGALHTYCESRGSDDRLLGTLEGNLTASKEISEFSRETNGNSPSFHTGAVAVKIPSEQSQQGTEGGKSVIQGQSPIGRASEGRAEMVDQQHTVAEWKTNKAENPGYGHKLRCSRGSQGGLGHTVRD